MTPRTIAAPLAAGALVLAGVAGCTTTTVEHSSPSPVATTVKAAPLPSEPAWKGKAAGAVADVKVVDCPTAAGQQTAKLELVNSAKSARDYRILVIWLKNGNGTPLGSALVKQKAAAPGHKIALSGTAKVVAQADTCVLNVLAGTLK